MTPNVLVWIGWWMSMALPVALLLSVIGLLVLVVTGRAPWPVQSRLLTGLLVAYGLAFLAPVVVWWIDLQGRPELATVLSDYAPLRTPDASVWQVVGVPVLGALGCIWLGGSLCRIGRLVFDHRALRNLIHASSRLSDDRLNEMLGLECVNQLRRHAVRVCLNDADVGPCCLGLRRWHILLPEQAMVMLSRSQRDLVVRHELLHLQRGDVWLLYFQRLLQAIYWWNPVLRRLSDQLTVAREGQCDEAILDGGADPKAYAATLVELSAHPFVGPKFGVSAVSLFESLKRRLSHILNGTPSRRRAPLATGLALLFLGLSFVGVVVLDSLTERPASSAPGVSSNRTTQERSVGSGEDDRQGALFRHPAQETQGSWGAVGVVSMELRDANGKPIPAVQVPSNMLRSAIPDGWGPATPSPPPLLRPEREFRSGMPLYDDPDFSRRVIGSELERANLKVPVGDHPLYPSQR